MIHSRRRFVPRSAALVLACASLAGCATYETPPPPPPAPRALTINAQRGQSQAQQNKDKADCQSIASAQARSSGEWAQAFIDCMGPRGYWVQ